jgi:hypothetical protein
MKLKAEVEAGQATNSGIDSIHPPQALVYVYYKALYTLGVCILPPRTIFVLLLRRLPFPTYYAVHRLEASCSFSITAILGHPHNGCAGLACIQIFPPILPLSGHPVQPLLHHVSFALDDKASPCISLTSDRRTLFFRTFLSLYPTV